MKYFLLLIIFASCSSHTKTDDYQTEKDTITSLLVKTDTSHFTSHFINELNSLISNGKFAPAELHIHYLITNQTDTTALPEELDLGIEYHFTSTFKEKHYHLIVTRLKQVLLEYKALIISDTDTLYTSKGYAELTPGFFLGAETIEDDETGEAFLASEFIDLKQGISINIAAKNNNEPLKAIWKIPANNSPKANAYSPTLRLNVEARQ